MQVPIVKNNSNVQAHPMCSLDYALANIESGRINHYTSLNELINKFK